MAKAKKAVSATKPPRTKRGTNGKAALATKTSINGTATSGQQVTLDRRKASDRRNGPDRRSHNEPVPVERRKLERRVKVQRRRQIDPTTCERDYSADEVEFMNALDDYKRASGRMFPTCSEVLEVIRSLGYGKLPQAVSQAACVPQSQPDSASSPPSESDLG